MATATDAFTTLRQRSLRKALAAEEAEDEAAGGKGLPRMTPTRLLAAAVEHDGYETPELNDKLYLHFTGYRKIENLEPYTGLSALWLDSNGLSKIEGLEACTALRCLYLQQNLIERIENLEANVELRSIDLSNNHLSSVDNLACLPHLETLNLAKNGLATAAAIAHLSELPNVTTVDLSDNQLDGEGIFDVLRAMPKLCALKLAGNPIVRATKMYRKTLINLLPNLRHLDDRPVFDLERVAAEAYAAGGRDAEKAARQKYVEDERAANRASMQRFRDWRDETRERRAAELEELRAQAIAEGRDPETVTLQRRAYVTYGNVSMTDMEARERQMRELAVAEAEAERELVRGTGIMRLGARFAAGGADGPVGEELLDAERAAAAEGEQAGGTSGGASGSSFEIEEEKKYDAAGRSVESDAQQRRHAASGGVAADDGAVSSESEAESGGGVGRGGRSEPTVVPPAPAADSYSEGEEPLESKGIEDFAPSVASSAAEESDSDEEPEAPAAAAEDAIVAAPPAERELTAEEERERDEREWRVQESLRLYRERLAAEKAVEEDKAAGKAIRAPPAPKVTFPSDDAVAPAPPLPEATTKASPVPAWASGGVTSHWSEKMDFTLSKAVPKAKYDFDRVANAIRGAISSGRLPVGEGHDPMIIAALITAKECRMRFAALSEPAKDASGDAVAEAPAARPVKPIDELVKGGFDGPIAYKEYVKPPTALPSMGSGDGESESDSDEGPSDAAAGAASAARPLSREEIVASLLAARGVDTAAAAGFVASAADVTADAGDDAGAAGSGAAAVAGAAGAAGGAGGPAEVTAVDELD